MNLDTNSYYLLMAYTSLLTVGSARYVINMEHLYYYEDRHWSG